MSTTTTTTYKDAPTRIIRAGDTEFAYRELGQSTGVPVIFLMHLAANLDNWDAGHGGIFQNHREFVETTLRFLDR